MSTISVISEPLSTQRGIRYQFRTQTQLLTRADVVARWQNDTAFNQQFNQLLRDTPWDACRWETPPLSTHNSHLPFECVLLDAPELLHRPVDKHAFAEHFNQTDSMALDSLASDSIAAFRNLGNDAMLIVPTPVDGPDDHYTHLAAFIRSAPDWHSTALWQRLGQTISDTLGAQPVWVSTAGDGVAWLHIRLDSYPKYYHYHPYRSA